jgi:hypothetical protein
MMSDVDSSAAMQATAVQTAHCTAAAALVEMAGGAVRGPRVRRRAAPVVTQPVVDMTGERWSLVSGGGRIISNLGRYQPVHALDPRVVCIQGRAAYVKIDK